MGSRLFVTADGHFRRLEGGFVSVMATPNVFFEPASLTDYLSNFLGEEEAQALATELAFLPLGTVTPQEAGAVNPADLFFTDANLEREVDIWGLDLGLEPGCLVHRVVELGEGVGDLPPIDDQLEAVDAVRVVVVLA